MDKREGLKPGGGSKEEELSFKKACAQKLMG